MDPRQFLILHRAIDEAQERSRPVTLKITEAHDYDAIREILNLATAKNLNASVSLRLRPRTIPQNSYLHFLCQYFATEYGCTTAEAKEVYLKRQAAPEIFAQVVVNKHNQQVTRYRSTADLTVEETSSAIVNFISWAALGGIDLPLPDDKPFIAHCRHQIEREQQNI